MPAPETDTRLLGNRPVLGHVNLMVDTFITNTNVADLRAIVRGMLATSPPSVTSQFMTAARVRLVQTNTDTSPVSARLFTERAADGNMVPTPELQKFLKRIRALYGAGMGFASLQLLAVAVRATIGLQWDEGGETEALLAAIDTDISQAIQSSREEMDARRVADLAAAREQVNGLRSAVKESQCDVDKWGGSCPFEQGADGLDFWKI
ncbi:hypothetical protein B0H21DRAFT_749757 [Amylocystis lapponica]|nr:hypothetical protein B0H21DRAFT_749757 [Amylocystis lapponica]